MRGFEIARSELFETKQKPYISFSDKKLKFGAACAKKFGPRTTIELLIHPIEKKFAIRPTKKENRNHIVFSKQVELEYKPREISSAAFSDTIFRIMGWNHDCRYRIQGSLYESGEEIAYIFDAADTEAFFSSSVIRSQAEANSSASVTPLNMSGKRIKAIPEQWTTSFGKPFYLHEQTLSALETQSKNDWQLRMEGQLFETGKKITVTSFDVLKKYIRQELSTVTGLEGQQ